MVFGGCEGSGMKIYRGANNASPFKSFGGGSYVGAHFSLHLSQRSHVILPVCTMTFGMIRLQKIGMCVCVCACVVKWQSRLHKRNIIAIYIITLERYESNGLKVKLLI